LRLRRIEYARRVPGDRSGNTMTLTFWSAYIAADALE